MSIEAQAPTRISLFGGGTDVNPYAEDFGGLVVSMAIDRRQHLRFYDPGEPSPFLSDVFPPRGNPEFFHPLFERFGYRPSRIYNSFDGKIEGGLGSSAAAMVAAVGAVSHRLGLELTQREIAETAWELEVTKLDLFGGKQDQYAATFGGFNLMTFGSSVKVEPFPRGTVEPLLPGLVLLDIGKNRVSARIQEGFRQLTLDQIHRLDGLKSMALEAIGPIERGDIREVGRLLDVSWQLKRGSNRGVTNSHIDAIYDAARKSGAYGGKILGAGGGGHFLFAVDPDLREPFTIAMERQGVCRVDFGVDYLGLEIWERPQIRP